MGRGTIKRDTHNSTPALAKGGPTLMPVPGSIRMGTPVCLDNEDVRVIRLALIGYANDMDLIHFESGEQARAQELIERSERW